MADVADGGTVTGPEYIHERYGLDPERVKARHRQAAIFAGELANYSPALWTARASGARLARHTSVDSHVLIEDAVIGSWELARAFDPPPSKQELMSRSGPGGVVVMAQPDGKTWSTVARSGGPFLVLHDWLNAVWRVDGDDEWESQLAMIVSELYDVSQGRPPISFDDPRLPPMPKLPWHKD